MAVTAPTTAATTHVPTAAPGPAAAPLDPFIQACLDRIGYLDQIAALMLWSALLLALLAGVVAVYAVYKVATKEPDPAPQGDSNEGAPSITPAVLEPLGKFLEVVSKLQVWFFLFLAGVALAWFASNISDGGCGNAPAPVAKVTPGKAATAAPTATPAT